MITMTCLAFVAIVAPVQVSMLESRFNAFFVINCCVDMVFVVDLVLQFFLMYPKKTDYGFELEYRHSEIVKHYLKSWFVIDVLSVIPFDLIGILSTTDELANLKMVKTIRLMRLLKLVRVLKSSRVFRRFEVRMSITYGTLALLKFFVILTVITHWLANLWALTLVLVEETDGVPRWIDAFEEQEKNVVDKTKDTPWKLYLTCMYFTSYTITSVGYGDIGPVNIIEMIVCTLMIVVSGLSWAVVLGQVCGIVANLDCDEQTFRSTMDELNLMMRDRSMQKDMQQRLRGFFLSNKTAQRRARHNRIIAAMSPGLQGEVIMQLNRMWITKVRLLAKILEESENINTHGQGCPFYMFIVQVSQQMKVASHAQSEIFGQPHVMYIMNRGLAGRNGRIQQAGNVWGVDFVLTDINLLQPMRAFSFTYVEVTTLQRQDFMDIVDSNDTTCPGLKKRIRHYCCWLAFQRAFLREAKRRMRGVSKERGVSKDAAPVKPKRNCSKSPKTRRGGFSPKSPSRCRWNPIDWQSR